MYRSRNIVNKIQGLVANETPLPRLFPGCATLQQYTPTVRNLSTSLPCSRFFPRTKGTTPNSKILEDEDDEDLESPSSDNSQGGGGKICTPCGCTFKEGWMQRKRPKKPHHITYNLKKRTEGRNNVKIKQLLQATQTADNMNRVRKVRSRCGGDVYILGVHHGTVDSMKAAKKAVRILCPDLVMIELCEERIELLDHGNPCEYTVAFKYAQYVPGCEVVLGDRLDSVSDARFFDVIPWYAPFYRRAIYKAINATTVRERDAYMSHMASRCLDRLRHTHSGCDNYRPLMLMVVGAGHVQGIRDHVRAGRAVDVGELCGVPVRTFKVGVLENQQQQQQQQQQPVDVGELCGVPVRTFKVGVLENVVRLFKRDADGNNFIALLRAINIIRFVGLLSAVVVMVHCVREGEGINNSRNNNNDSNNNNNNNDNNNDILGDR